MGIRPDGQSVKGTTRVSYGDRRLMRSLFIHVKASRQERARDNRKLTKNDKDAANEMPMRRARRSFTAFWKKVRTAPKRFEPAANDTDALATRVMTSSAWIDFVDRWRALEADRVALSSVGACARRCAAAAQKRSRPTDRDATLDAHIERVLHDVFGKSKDGAELHETATVMARLHRSFVVEEDEEDQKSTSLHFEWSGVSQFLGAALGEATVPTEHMPLLHTRRNVRLLHHYARVRAARAAYRESTSRTCEFAQVHMGKRKRREQDALSAMHSAHDDAGGIGDDSATSHPVAKKKRNSYSAQCAAWTAQVLDSDRGYEYVHVSHDGPDVALTGAAPSSLYWLEPNYFDVRGSSVIDVLRDYSTIDDEMRRAHRDRFGVVDSLSPSTATTTPSPSAERRQRLLSVSTGGGDTDTATPSPLAISLQQRQNTVDFVTAHEVERHASLWTVCHRCGEPLHTCDMVVTRGLLAHDVSCYHAQCSAEYSLLQRRHRRRRHCLLPQVSATAVPKKAASKRKRAAKDDAGGHVIVDERRTPDTNDTGCLLDRLERQMIVRSAETQ